jgi:hypothetical protein
MADFIAPALNLIPIADKAGLPPPADVQAIEATQREDGRFDIATVTIDGDATNIGLFPNWYGVLGTFRDHVAASRWEHWESQ